jgi:hypothetical protein
MSETLDRMREAGWMVAVHNDYTLQGNRWTFWLFTHPLGIWAKGEGRNDEAALAEAEAMATARAQDTLLVPAQPSQAQQAGVTEAMVEAAKEVFYRNRNYGGPRERVRAALTAALSARQGDGA